MNTKRTLSLRALPGVNSAKQSGHGRLFQAVVLAMTLACILICYAHYSYFRIFKPFLNTL